MDPRTTDLLLQMEEQNKRLAPRVAALMARDPQLKPWTAFVIASDEEGIERARKEVAEGGDPLTAVHTLGSYARFGAAVELLPPQVMYRHIGDLWRGADPDDSDPRFLAVWKKARRATVGEGKYIRDGDALPSRARKVRVFRGQDPGEPSGIAWSLSFDTAEKFATGAATRQGDREGIVLTGEVDRSKVIAYLTLRGEYEVILDPADLTDVMVWATYSREVRREPKDAA